MKLLIAMLFALCTGAAFARIHIDDAGRRIELSAPAQRVITLAPNLTELVYAVEGGSTMVGTVNTSDHPEAAKAVVRIGDHQRLDVERILALKPDLVLVWLHGNAGRELAQLEAAGLRLFYLDPRRLDEIAQALERVGALLGREAQGRRQAAQLRDAIAELRASHAKAAPVTVFHQVWSRPLMTLNDEHVVSEVIALCGGRNVFGGLPQLVPQLSVESVVAANPEVMFTARESATEGPGWRRDPRLAAFATWAAFPKLTAVRRGWMYSLPGDAISRQGPRIVEGVRAVCTVLDEVRRERRSTR